MFKLPKEYTNLILENEFTNAYQRNLKETNGNFLFALEDTFAECPELNLAYNAIAPEGEKVDFTRKAMRALDSDNVSKEDKDLAEKYLKVFHGVSNVSNVRNLDTASNPGGANLMQTSLIETIFHRATQIDRIYPLVTKANFTTNQKLDYPVFNRQLRATFIAENANVATNAQTDFETAVTGITKVTLDQKTFAIDLTLTYQMEKSTSPTLIRQLVELTAKGIARGRESQILNGAGGANATGLILNATTATAGADALETLTNGVGSIGGVNIDFSSMRIAMNMQAYAKFMALRAFNDPSYNLIGDWSTPSIQGIPVIITNELLTTAGSTTVVVGDFSHYVWAQTSNAEMLRNNPANAANLESRYVFATTADGKPLFNDSFAKFALTI